MPDQLSTLYRDLLEGSYDCVDRVVLNAYFSMGQTGGGLRVWWRELHGSDANLDDNHLMRMAGRFSRRLRAWARANHVPVVYSSPGERKHDIAAEHLATHDVEPGLFMVLVSKAPALVWEAHMTGTGKLGQLKQKEPWPYVNHYCLRLGGLKPSPSGEGFSTCAPDKLWGWRNTGEARTPYSKSICIWCGSRSIEDRHCTARSQRGYGIWSGKFADSTMCRS
jgi:hypothetical protein